MADWEKDEVISQPSGGGWQSDPVIRDAQPSGNAGRQVGLTIRSAISGLAAIPGVGADGINTIINLGIDQWNQRTGNNIPKLPMATESLERGLSRVGLPEPQNATERVVYDVNRAVSGGAGLVKAGAQMAGAAPGLVRNIGQVLRTRPDIQAEAAAGGAAASGFAREQGYGPGVQAGAGVVGSVTAPSVVQIGSTAAKSTWNAAKPFTQGGREQIVGRTLSDMASNEFAARDNLSRTKPVVPGSQPTTAAASKDPGLATTERMLKSNPAAGGRFAERYAKQNAARQTLLDSIAKDKEEVARAVAYREEVTAPIREAAFGNKKPAQVQPVLEQIDAVLSSPKGRRESVKNALTWLRGKIEKETDPEALYAIRQDIGDAMDGKFSGEQANFRLARRELIAVRDALDNAIEAGAPGFKEYLSKYREASRPLNQMETLQDVRSRVLNAGVDAQGLNVMSHAKWFNVVTKNKDELAKTLTKEQMKNLLQIGKDLDRGAFVEYAGKASGSPTYQNFSTANLVGSMLGGKMPESPLMQTLTRPLSWIYKVPDAAMQEMLVDAMLDPATAQMLMFKATPKSVEVFARELAIKARAMGLGEIVGEASRQSQGERSTQ